MSVTKSGGSKFVGKYYGEKILLTRVGKSVTVIIAIAYLGASVAGLYRINVGFRVQSLFLDDYVGKRYFDLISDYFWDKGWQMEVLVRNPGDLSDPNHRWRQKDMQERYETTEFSISMHGSEFWLNQYLDFVGDTAETNTFKTWTRRIWDWAHMNDNEYRVSRDLAWRNSTEEERKKCNCDHILIAYRFRVALQNYSDAVDQMRCQDIMRGIASEYPDLDIVTYMPESAWLDQYRGTLPLTKKNILFATICMIVIASLFLMDITCLVSIVLCIISIDVGVLGFMGWWGVRLDFISMCTILMSIGLSVDYSAHITYAYKTSPETTSHGRVLAALGDVGLPVFQGAFSTLLGVVMLGFTGTYLGTSFFRVVVLVIVFGMAHGCAFLPVIFEVTGSLSESCKKRRCISSKEEPSAVI